MESKTTVNNLTKDKILKTLIPVKEKEIDDYSNYSNITPKTNDPSNKYLSNKILEKLNEDNYNSINLLTPENSRNSKIDLDDLSNNGISNYFLLDNNENENNKNDLFIKNKLKEELLNVIKNEIENNSVKERQLKEEIEEIKNLYKNQNQNILNKNYPNSNNFDINKLQEEILKEVIAKSEENFNEKFSTEQNKFKRELLLIVKNEFNKFESNNDIILNEKEISLQIKIREEILNLLKSHFEHKIIEEEKLIHNFKQKIAENDKLNKEKDDQEYNKLKDEFLQEINNLKDKILIQANLLKNFGNTFNNTIGRSIIENNKLIFNEQIILKEEINNRIREINKDIIDNNSKINNVTNQVINFENKIENIPYLKINEIEPLIENIKNIIDDKIISSIKEFEKNINEKNLKEEKKLKLEIINIINQQIEIKIKDEEIKKKEENEKIYNYIEKDLLRLKEELSQKINYEMIKQFDDAIIRHLEHNKKIDEENLKNMISDIGSLESKKLVSDQSGYVIIRF